MTGELGEEKTYWAFISYSSRDKKWGRWLQRQLEGYTVPRPLRGHKLSDGTVLGSRLRPIFRDRDELAGSAELAPAIRSALQQSRYLIVLCSPHAAASKWVNQEIEDFRELVDSKYILALIIDGEPNATSNPELPNSLECFPPALRYPAEPLAGDLRREGDGRERGFLKILAGVAEVGFDELYRRHERMQRKRRTALAAFALLIIGSLTGLSVYAIRQKAVAERQTDEARTQKIAADISAQEAARERDQAKAILSRLYLEKANRQDNAIALAWAVAAAETNPEVVNDSSFQGRVDRWRGPWPCPSLCLQTGAANDGILSDPEFFLSPDRSRLLVQLTDHAWRLLDLKERTEVTSEIAPSLIRKIVPIHDDCFLIDTRRGIEIRHWGDGQLLGKITSGDFVAVAGRKVLVADKREPAIRVWEPDNNSEVQFLRPPGKLTSIIGTASEGTESIVGIIRSNKAAPELFKANGTQSGQWGPAETIDAGEHKLQLLRAENLPPGVVNITTEASRSTLLFDFDTNRLSEISLKPDEQWGLVTRRAGKLVARIYEPVNRNTSDRKLQQLDCETGAREPWLDGKEISAACHCPLSKLTLTWSRERNEFELIPSEGPRRIIPIPFPYWMEFWHFRIQEVSQNVFSLSGTSSPGHHELVLLLMLEPDGTSKVRVLGSCKAEAVLDSNDRGAIVLSHEGTAVSYFDDVKTLEEVTATDSASRWSVDCRPFWMHLDNEGVPRVVGHQFDEEKSLRLVSGTRQGEWLTAELGRSVLDVEGEYTLVERSSGQTAVLDSQGQVAWEPSSSRQTKALLYLVEDRVCALVASAQSLTLTNIREKRTVWSIKFPGYIEDFCISPTAGTIQILHTRQDTYQAAKPWYSLVVNEVSLSSGEEVEQWTWKVSGQEAKQLAERYPELELICGQQCAVLLETGTFNLRQGQLLQPVDSSSLKTAQTWTRSESQDPHQLPHQQGFLLDTTNRGESRKELSWFRNSGNDWIVSPIPLRSTVSELVPSPDGDRVLVQCQDEVFLWDLISERQIGNALRIEASSEFGQGIDVPGYFSAAWHPDGDQLFMWGGSALHSFDGNTSAYLETLAAHTRKGRTPDGDDVKIVAVSVSVNDDWLVSADSAGQIVRSKLTKERISLESLKESSHHLGGRTITEKGDLGTWIPAESFQAAADKSVNRELTEEQRKMRRHQ